MQCLQELESRVATWLAGRVVLVDPGNLRGPTRRKGERLGVLSSKAPRKYGGSPAGSQAGRGFPGVPTRMGQLVLVNLLQKSPEQRGNDRLLLHASSCSGEL